jgi:hypothetical protein
MVVVIFLTLMLIIPFCLFGSLSIHKQDDPENYQDRQAKDAQDPY